MIAHLAIFYKTSPSRSNIKNVNTPQIDISKHKVQMSCSVQSIVLALLRAVWFILENLPLMMLLKFLRRNAQLPFSIQSEDLAEFSIVNPAAGVGVCSSTDSRP